MAAVWPRNVGFRDFWDLLDFGDVLRIGIPWDETHHFVPPEESNLVFCFFDFCYELGSHGKSSSNHHLGEYFLEVFSKHRVESLATPRGLIFTQSATFKLLARYQVQPFANQNGGVDDTLGVVGCWGGYVGDECISPWHGTHNSHFLDIMICFLSPRYPHCFLGVFFDKTAISLPCVLGIDFLLHMVWNQARTCITWTNLRSSRDILVPFHLSTVH